MEDDLKLAEASESLNTGSVINKLNNLDMQLAKNSHAEEQMSIKSDISSVEATQEIHKSNSRIKIKQMNSLNTALKSQKNIKLSNWEPITPPLDDSNRKNSYFQLAQSGAKIQLVHPLSKYASKNQLINDSQQYSDTIKLNVELKETNNDLKIEIENSNNNLQTLKYFEPFMIDVIHDLNTKEQAHNSPKSALLVMSAFYSPANLNDARARDAINKIQSFYRAKKEYRKYGKIIEQKKQFSGYLAYGRRIIDGKEYFLAATKQGFNRKKLRELLGVSEGKSDKSNVVLEAYPLKSGTDKPKNSIYSTSEICHYLGILSLDELFTTPQPGLLDIVEIENGRAVFKRESKRKKERKRLIFKGRTKFKTAITYQIRIYEIDLIVKQQYIAIAIHSGLKIELKIEATKLVEVLKLKHPQFIVENIHEAVKLMFIQNGELLL